MTTAEMAAPGLSDTEHQVQLRRAVVAGTVGTVIEAYDFLLYVLVAPLVFAKLYFPGSDPLVGTLQAFGIYAVGFISRPVGAAFFGHYGDRIGRKATLIATLLLTGLSTFAVGFVPGYASIGIWGAVILTIVRFIQGMGIGGEWGGATLIAMEWAKTNAHRGFITGWTQWGGPAGLFFANIAVLAMSAISGDQFLDWGWRVPFWISIVMVGVGLYIRLGILETPVFQRLLDEERVASAPVIEVIRRQPRQIILTALCRMAEQAPFYIFAAFVFTYGTTVLHSSRDLLLTALLTATGLSVVTIPLSGYISDRIGRKRMYLIGHDGDIRLSLLRNAEHGCPRRDLLRHHPVFHPARHDVRAAGGIDRRMLQPTPALQRCLARVSFVIGHCRRTGAADRHGAVRGDRVGLFDRDLHFVLCDRQRFRYGVPAGLHEPRHLARRDLRHRGRAGWRNLNISIRAARWCRQHSQLNSDQA
jgi:MFS family permease